MTHMTLKQFAERILSLPEEKQNKKILYVDISYPYGVDDLKIDIADDEGIAVTSLT